MKRVTLLTILMCVISCTQSFGQTYTWKSVNIQGMGYVSGMAIHPTSNDIYIRTDVGGAYRYDAINSAWIPITDGMVTSYSVEALAVNPSNENEVFIIVGNNEAGKLYKSSDKGSTWQQLSNFSVNVQGNSPWRNDDPRLSVDPNNGGKVMFFASRANGLWKSTDSGVTWAQVATSLIPAGTASSGGQAFVVFDKNSGNATTNSTTLYVGVAGNGVYKSTNGGAGFTLLSGGPLASKYNPVNTAIASDGTLYVTYCQGWNDGLDGKVYKFSTAGTATNITPPTNNGLSFASIAVSKTDPNKIVTWQWRWGEVKGIHYSTNAGSSWAAKTCSQANFNSPSWWDKSGALNWDYCGGIAFDPLNSNKVWFTSGHGVFYANDITVANPVYNTAMANLEELVALQVSVPTAPNTTHLYLSCADQQGFVINNRDVVPAKSMSSGGSASCGGGFGMNSSIDYCIADPNFVVRVADNEAWTSPAGYAQYSTDAGANWNCVANKPTGAASGNIAISATNKNSWVWSPINSSGNSLNVMPYFTTNGGTSWTACTGITTGNNFASQQWSASKFLVSDKVNGTIFYYYSYDNTNSDFYRSTNSGAAFTKISTNALPGNWKVKMEAVPGKEKNLFFCSKEAGSSLYFSSNGGDTWITISGVSNCSTFGFGKAIGSSTNPTLFVYATINATQGIYYSTDLGTTWSANVVAANVPASSTLDLSGDMREEYTIYLATDGRGIIYGTASVANVLVTGVSVSPTTATVSVGNTQQLTATVSPANATNKNVSWSSSNTSIATVNSTGLVTAVAAGSATITVTTQDGNKLATSAITVTGTAIAVTGVSVSPTTASISLGSTQQLTATVSPANATNKNVSWSSSNTSIATVNSTGLVTAVAAGSATITVTTQDGNKLATSAITVTGTAIAVTGVVVSPTSATISSGSTQQLIATVSPANATSQNISWSSSNTAIATVNSTGIVTPVAAGSTTITVTTTDGSKTASCAVTITPLALNQTPYIGVISLPGKVEAENYDNGGENVAYHDADAGNSGGAFRTSDGVDIQTCSEGGYHIGWTDNGEWLEYTVNPSAGTYDIEVRYAGIAAGTIEVAFSNGTKTSGDISLPSTGGWDTWTTVTKTAIALNGGEQIMRINLKSAGFNLNYINITVNSVSPVNLATSGVGYRWSKNTSVTSNSNRVASTGIKDGNLATDVKLNNGANENANRNEAAGVVWATTQSIGSVYFTNGSWLSGKGSFTSGLQLQFSNDGTTWVTATDWTVAPFYAYNASNAGTSFKFSGPSVSGKKGVRIVGQLYTNSSGSREAFVREVEVYSTSLNSARMASETLVSSKVSFSVNLFPNPVTDVVNIQIDSYLVNESFQIEIINATGKRLYQDKIYGNLRKTINLSALPKGVYILKVSNNLKLISKKLIVL